MVDSAIALLIFLFKAVLISVALIFIWKAAKQKTAPKTSAIGLVMLVGLITLGVFSASSFNPANGPKNFSTIPMLSERSEYDPPPVRPPPPRYLLDTAFPAAVSACFLLVGIGSLIMGNFLIALRSAMIYLGCCMLMYAFG